MAKKNTTQIINPHFCVQSLEEYLRRLFGLRNTIPDVIQYIKKTPNNNQPLKDFMIKTLEKHWESVQEFHTINEVE